jgi:hypothetical protein
MTTTMNTGAASLSDEQILDVLCGHDERPFHRPHGTRLVYNAFEDEYDLREIVLRRARELIALATPTQQADAAIAAGGAQEPAQSWIDGVAAELWAIADVSGFDDFKLAVGGFLIATALPRVAATVRLTDDQIVSIWEGMPDGASGFRKSWGYLQFARALLAASNGEQA